MVEIDRTDIHLPDLVSASLGLIDMSASLFEMQRENHDLYAKYWDPHDANCLHFDVSRLSDLPLYLSTTGERSETSLGSVQSITYTMFRRNDRPYEEA